MIFINFDHFLGERVKILEILSLFDPKWAFFAKTCDISKNLISLRLFIHKAYEAEIWSGCSPRHIQKTGAQILHESAPLRRYTLFYTQKLEKVSFLNIFLYKECVAAER